MLSDNEMTKYPEYAARFKRAWKESGTSTKTQKELAKLLGYSQATISEWINGEKLPSMDTALKISEKLHCCVVWLLTGRAVESNVFLGLTDCQRQLIEQMAAQFIKNNPGNKSNSGPIKKNALVLDKRDHIQRRIEDQIALLNADPRTADGFHDMVRRYKKISSY